MSRILDRIEVQKFLGIFDLRVGIFIIALIDFFYSGLLASEKTGWYYTWAIFACIVSIVLALGGYLSLKRFLVPWLIYVITGLWFYPFIFVWTIWVRFTTETSDDTFQFISLLLFKIFSYFLHGYFFSVVYSFFMQLFRESREPIDDADIEAYM